MSLNIACKITISDHEAGIKDAEILSIVRFASSTGSFSSLPLEIVKSLVAAAAEGGTKDMIDKLKLIKGTTND